MYTTPLFLSHWDASTPVCVTASCVKDLKDYQIMGVRFLYDCFQKKQRGVILNHEDGMNFEIQVAAFLNALHPIIPLKNLVLIICSEETINNWNYHLVNHGGYDVTVLTQVNSHDIVDTDTKRVVLSTFDNTAALKEIKANEFFCVIVDHFDKLVSKQIVKQMKGQFNVGLTHRNFVKHPDQKLFWTMVNWANPGVLGKFADFCEEDNDHINNLRCPYDKWWQRLTWKYCDSFICPTDAETREYQTKLKDWCRTRKIFEKSEIKRQTRKRRLPSSDSETDAKEQKNIPKQEPKRTAVILKSDTNVKDVVMDTSVGVKMETSSDSTNSDDTVIYSPVGETDDDNLILSSIVSGKVIAKQDSCTTNNERESSRSNRDAANDEDDVVLSVINNEPSRKDNLLSLLYGSDL